MYRILVSDKLGQAGLNRLDQMEDVSYEMKTGLSKDELMAILPEYDALIVRSGTKPDADVIAAGTRLKVIGRAGIGVDNIDIDAATRRGIIVMNTPRANAVATAEQTMALMLAVSRHTALSHASVAAGEWRRSLFVGHELYRKTLGIIGFGNIGRLVSQRAQAFGMDVVAYDPYVSEAVGREWGVTLVDLDDLLAQSTYITLHTVVTPETEKMINAESIAKMKTGAFLINVARGKLVDEEALAQALRSGKLRGAALDVYQSEPPENSPLLRLPNVTHTPHLGASTREAQRAVAVEMVEQVVEALRGTDFRNALNIPFPAGINFATVRPYMLLAEKIGAIQCSLATTPIRRVELAVQGEKVQDLVRPLASATLKGILSRMVSQPVNYINAPILAQEHEITLAQTNDIQLTHYPNTVSCRVVWDGGERTIAGVLFGGSEPRIVQVDEYILDAQPEGVVLVLQNKDVPGVIGQVGTILATHNINIGEWRMGRQAPGGQALSFINLDSEPPIAVLQALEKNPAITNLTFLSL